MTPMRTTTTAPEEHEAAGPDPLALHDAERDAHDRRRERGDDHRPDDRGRGVGQHARRRDDPREHEHRPERRLLGPGVPRPEVEVVGELVEGAPLVLGQDAVPQTDVHGAEYAGTAARLPRPGGTRRAGRLASRRCSGRTRVPSSTGGRHGPVSHRQQHSSPWSPSVGSLGPRGLLRRHPSRPRCRPEPVDARRPATPIASASPTGVPVDQRASPTAPASAPAGFSLDDVTSAGFPDLGGDLGGIGVVRVGRHTGYDRVVWQFPAPGGPTYQVHYVDEPTADGSGDVVDVRGDAYLEADDHARSASRPTAHRSPRTPPASSIAGTVDRPGAARLRRLRGLRPGLRRRARPASARSRSPC